MYYLPLLTSHVHRIMYENGISMFFHEPRTKIQFFYSFNFKEKTCKMFVNSLCFLFAILRLSSLHISCELTCKWNANLKCRNFVSLAVCVFFSLPFLVVKCNLYYLCDLLIHMSIGWLDSGYIDVPIPVLFSVYIKAPRAVHKQNSVGYKTYWIL